MTGSTVTLTIDGRDVEVPAGTGLVEAAASADIEIPVFCYEPRLGAPVGACRMCLVEVEGARGLQAACALKAGEGMVVSTVSEAARNAQESVLEFLLINHPLDCPVCDKGGECPLQDQAYRWGAGATRFGEIKRNNDKPIPISPLIALDRERCILCYRCSRFSSDVAGDNQLIARERGANSVIATFEGRPYDAHFSGNIVELCPVGALTSTEFRFRGRPWESPDHPTVCTLCPVGCNVYSTVREGEVIRMLGRQNDAVDRGWLCDRGRFSYTSLYSEARLRTPVQRGGHGRPAGNRPATPVSHEVAAEWLHDQLASAPGALWVLSGNETLEEAWVMQRIAAATGGSVVAVDGASAAVPRAAATIADVAAARHILIVGDTELVDIAPVLELRVREAMQAGASVSVVGMGGSALELAGAHLVPATPDSLDGAARDVGDRVRAAAGNGPLSEPGIVIYRDGELSEATLEALALAFTLPREGSGFIAIPAAANARGLAALGIEPVGIDTISDHGGPIILSGVDPSRHWRDEQWRPVLTPAPWLAALTMFDHPGTDVAGMTIPLASFQEREGTSVNLEGRLQRLTAGAAPPDDVRPQLSWLTSLARRLDVDLPGSPAGVFRAMAASLRAGILPVGTHAEIPAEGVLGVAGSVTARPMTPASLELREGELALNVSPFVYDAADVQHAARMEFLRNHPNIVLSRTDAAARGLAQGDRATVTMGDPHPYEVTVVTSRRLAPGHARMHAGTAGLAPGRTGYVAARVAAVTSAIAHGAAEGATT